MDPASWSAYSQHLSRLTASVNTSSPFTHSSQMTELGRSSTLPRQDHHVGYANTSGHHSFLLAPTHQTSSRSEQTFNSSSLFIPNYDASLLSPSFQSSNKGHISLFPQSSGFFKPDKSETDFNDLRTGFSHCNMASYAQSAESGVGLSGSSPLGSNSLFTNSAPSRDWRPSNILTPSCGPFGVLPHETVEQHPQISRRSEEKHRSSSKIPQSAHHSSFVEQNLTHYHGILTCQAHTPSTYIDPNNPNHSPLLLPQNDSYFSSVPDSYYSPCSKSEFSTYSSYCANMQNVQRNSISPYYHSHSYGIHDTSTSMEHSSSTSVSANSSFPNFVPNNNLSHSDQSNGSSFLTKSTLSRQTVITSNTNNSSFYDSHLQEIQTSNTYTQQETYSCPTGSIPTISISSSGGRPPTSAHSASHHPSSNHLHYPNMRTPIEAAIATHSPSPSTMGQAHIPNPLPINRESSIVMHNSPTNDSYYSVSETSRSDSASPVKHEFRQHSSLSIFSLDNTRNVGMNGTFVDPSRMHSRSRPKTNFTQVTPFFNNSNGSLTEKLVPKVVENNMLSNPDLVKREHTCLNNFNFQLDTNPNIPHSTSGFQNSSTDCKLSGRQVYPKNRYQSTPQNFSQLSPLANNNEGKPCNYSSSSFVETLDSIQKSKNKLNEREKHSLDESTFKNLHNYQSRKSISCILRHNVKRQDFHSPEGTQDIVTVQQDVSNTSSVPINLFNVPSLNTATRQEECPIISHLNTCNKSAVVNEPIQNSGMSPTEWTRLNQNADSEEPLSNELQETHVSSQDSSNNGIRSSTQDLSFIDDLSDENKTEVTNMDDDLGYLVELSTTSDVGDTTSKESYCEEKKIKPRCFLQSFLTFLESNNNLTVSSKPKKVENSRKLSHVRYPSSQLLLISHKDIEHNSSWLINKEIEKMGESSKTDKGEKDNKDHFDEAPSLDSGLFGYNTLQKEMVLPNPEAPSFSSDEDENSTQCIFDSVAMAIRLCDDKDDDDKTKNMEGTKKQSGKSCGEHDVGNDNRGPRKSDENDTQINEPQPNVPSLIVKQRRMKRKHARHLLVVKVNQIKRKNLVVHQTVKVANNTEKKRVPPIERTKLKTTTSCSLSRRPLMRKCKQNQFQQHRGIQRKSNTRSSTKRKYLPSDQEQKELIVLDDEDETTKDSEKVKKKLKPEKMKWTPRRRNRHSLDSSVATSEVSKNILSSPKKQRERKHHQRYKHCKTNFQVSKKGTIDGYSKSMRKTTDLFALPEGVSNAPKIPGSTSGEVPFKSGDFVTTVDTIASEQPPIWRIESKNVLKLFEAFEIRKYSVRYRNTSSYSRWSPSLKQKYSLVAVNIIKCDGDTVIIEKSKKVEDIEAKEPKNLVFSDNYAIHPHRENFEVYIQTLVSHALDHDFIPEIVNEKDEYFLSHLEEIEKVAIEKKQRVLSGIQWDSTFQIIAELYPDVNVNSSLARKHAICQFCSSSYSQYTIRFCGHLYDTSTLEMKADKKKKAQECDGVYMVCESCMQVVTLYSRLHHHRYHFYQMACKKVRDVQRGNEKNSHTVLEECLQDTKWMIQMFSDMIELWTSCDKYR